MSNSENHAHHTRNDSGFDDSFLIDIFQKKVDKISKSNQKTWLQKTRKRILTCCLSVTLLIVIIIVVVIVTSKGSSSLADLNQSSTKNNTTGTKNQNETQSYLSPIVWPLLPISQQFTFYTLMNSTSIAIYDTAQSNPKIITTNSTISAIYSGNSKDNSFVVGNLILSQYSFSKLQFIPIGSLNQNFQTNIQSTPLGLFYQTDANTILKFNVLSTIAYYNSPIIMSAFYFNTTSLLLYTITDSTIFEINPSGMITRTFLTSLDAKYQYFSLLSFANKLYAQASDLSIYEFDIQTFTQTRVIQSTIISSTLTFNPDKNSLYIYFNDGSIKEYDLHDPSKILTVFGPSDTQSAGLQYSLIGKVLLIGRGNRVVLWDPSTRTTVFSLVTGESNVNLIVTE